MLPVFLIEGSPLKVLKTVHVQNRYCGVQTVHESIKSKLKVHKRVCKIIVWPWTRAVRILPADPTQIQLSVRISPQFCIKFTKACVGSLPSTLWCREPKFLPVFLSSQHFVPLANVIAFKGAEKTREIYTVNHFCAETAEEGLSLAGKHRRLCAIAAKKLIYMCPPHFVFIPLLLSLGFHPHDLSWRPCQEDSDLLCYIPQDVTL